MDNKYLYICDGCACKRQCAKTMTADEWKKHTCHHTEDEKHAVNKIRRERKFRNNGNGAYVEVKK